MQIVSNRKFGKHLQKRQLDIPEYAASFVNYKALKKVSLFHPYLLYPKVNIEKAHKAVERHTDSSGSKCIGFPI